MKNHISGILSLLCILLFLETNRALGQQDPQYSMYMFNTLSVNPAYAGTRDAISFNLLNRNQWIGYPGAPVTQTLTVHGPMFHTNVGAGLNVTNDKIGPVRNTNAYLNFSYRIRLGKGNLSFGLKAGGDIMRLDLASLNTIQQNDPSFINNTSTGFMPNFGAGLYYFSKRFYFGASIPRSLSDKFWKTKNVNGNRIAREQAHYYFIGGCILKLNEYFKFKPSFQAKFTSGAPLQLDINGSFIYKDRLYFGAFYRLKDAVGLMVQLGFSDRFRAALAWDQTISDLRQYNNGSLELCLSYDLIFKKTDIKSPRSF